MRRVLLLLALCGCVSAPPKQPPPMNYDFGLAAPPLPVATPVHGTLAVADVVAPDWIAGEGIVYRLAYENEARPALYGESRWVAPPADLLTQRLLQRLARVATGGVMSQSAGVEADYLLRVELEEFSQVFDAPGQSRAVMRVRASLFEAKGGLLDLKTFETTRPARPNAAGAATSLRDAADEVIDQLGKWIVAEAAKKR